MEQRTLIKRRRFKHTQSLEERLVEDTGHLRDQAAMLPPGHTRDELMRRIRQNETASHLCEWLRSPGLRTPE
jgi:hypothetical protein